MTISARVFDGKLSTVLIKVTNTCNFSCPRCYMFRANDTSFRFRPKQMPRDIVDATVACLRRYIEGHELEELEVILHGGEPLLLRTEDMEYVLTGLSTLTSSCKVRLCLQTNGSLISKPFTNLFKNHQVHVGVSLDGDRSAQDRSRTSNGASTYNDVVHGISLLQEELGSEMFRGLLGVVDLESDPVCIYKHFRSLGIERMDFLLPLRNHAYPLDYDPGKRAYARWLEQMFDCYMSEDNPAVTVRIFTSIIDLLLGAELPMCSIRHSAADIATVETDGSIELVDDLRICGEDFTRAGVHVLTNEISDLFETAKFQALLDAEKEFPRPCRTCPQFNICGSGGHAFRYGPDGSFDHPSIYCQETAELIDYIRATIFGERSGLSESVLSLDERRSEFAKRYFGTNASRSLTWTNGFLEYPTEIYDTFLPFVTKQGNILDIGCGNGLLLRHIREHATVNLTPFGVDFQQAAVQEARERVLPDFAPHFWVDDIESLNLGKETLFRYILFDPTNIGWQHRSRTVERISQALEGDGVLLLYSYGDGLAAAGVAQVHHLRGLEHIRPVGIAGIAENVSIAAVSDDAL